MRAEPFDFLGFPFEPGITGEVYASSVGRCPWPGIDTAIERVCDALQAKLDARYAGIGDRPTLPDAPSVELERRLVHRVEPQAGEDPFQPLKLWLCVAWKS